MDDEIAPDEVERAVDEAAAIEAARRGEVVDDSAGAPAESAEEDAGEAVDDGDEAPAEGCGGCAAAGVAEEAGEGEQGCSACPCQGKGGAEGGCGCQGAGGDAPEAESVAVADPDDPPVPHTPLIPERLAGAGPELELGVAFPHNAKVYSFSSGGLRTRIGEKVLVRTDLGVDLGDVVRIKGRLSPERIEELTPVVRAATEEDLAHATEQGERERRALEVCGERITAHKLPMKLIDAHLSFDNTRLVFLFASEGRVDFRELVRDLAKTFRMRIELRQVGVRDEAKLLGGLGPCGRQLCCKMFMRNFEPVGIRIAKDQGLALNPNKLSGLCDRLMCCLRFEHETYVEHKGRLPKKGTRVKVGESTGQVVSVYVLKEELRVRMEDGRDVTVHRSEIEPLGPGDGPAQPPVVERSGKPEAPSRPSRPSRSRNVTTRPASKPPTEDAAAPAEAPRESAAEGDKPAQGRPKRSRGRRRSSSRRKKQQAEGVKAQGDAGAKPAPQGGGDNKQAGGGTQEGGKPKRSSRGRRGRRGRGRSRKPSGESGGQPSGGTQN